MCLTVGTVHEGGVKSLSLDSSLAPFEHDSHCHFQNNCVSIAAMTILRATLMTHRRLSRCLWMRWSSLCPNRGCAVHKKSWIRRGTNLTEFLYVTSAWNSHSFVFLQYLLGFYQTLTWERFQSLLPISPTQLYVNLSPAACGLRVPGGESLQSMGC